jgi:hypothetical protein
MTEVVGGLRDRFIKDSVYQYLKHRLDLLGWFDAGRRHEQVVFLDEPQNLMEEITANTLALSTEDHLEEDVELGSGLSELRWQMYIDFYAENDDVGTHLIRDVAAILGGRMPSIDAARRAVPVYDFSAATPPVLFVVGIENVRTDKAHDWPHQWLRHWQSCAFEIVDSYDDEDL